MATKWPHLNQIRDPAVLRAELALVRERYNGVRLHAGIGYVTPNDEHQGRGPAIRKAREAGLEQATGQGWTVRAACQVLQVNELRVYRWLHRRAAGELKDRAPGSPMHGLLDWEVAEIIGLFDE